MGFKLKPSTPFLMKVDDADTQGISATFVVEKRFIMDTNPIVRYVIQRKELDIAILSGKRDPEVICPHLQAIIDGSALKQSAIPWSPVCTYVQKLKARSDLRGWGLTDERLLNLALTLQDHAGPLQPEGISLTLGKGLKYDLAEAEAWAKDNFAELGVSFTVRKSRYSMKLYGGAELPTAPTVAPAHLDLEKFWDKKDGISVDWVREQDADLPTTEPYWLLCLNPEAWLAIDGKTMPVLRSPGVMVGDDYVLSFIRDGGEACVNYNWSDYQWANAAIAAFRG